jgi:type I restriction enzyme S subunit
MPSSLEEQEKIASFFNLIDEQIQVEKDKLEAIKQVKKGLLQQMFM